MVPSGGPANVRVEAPRDHVMPLQDASSGGLEGMEVEEIEARLDIIGRALKKLMFCKPRPRVVLERLSQAEINRHLTPR